MIPKWLQPALNPFCRKTAKLEACQIAVLELKLLWLLDLFFSMKKCKWYHQLLRSIYTFSEALSGLLKLLLKINRLSHSSDYMLTSLTQHPSSEWLRNVSLLIIAIVDGFVSERCFSVLCAGGSWIVTSSPKIWWAAYLTTTSCSLMHVCSI